MLNQMGATYRGDLREALELNYARFEARLDLRFAQTEARMEERLGRLRADLMSEITAIRIELAAVNARVDAKVDRGDFEAALRKQTRLVVGALASIFVGTAIPLIGLWLK